MTAPGLGECLLFWLFPARCLWCGRVVGPEEFFCKDCIGQVPAASPRQFQLERSGRVLTVRAPVQYRGGFRETLHKYKFQGQKGLCGQLGRLAAREALGFAGKADGVAFVPLYKKDRRKRGYDQSGLLAEKTARALGLSCLPLLTKVRRTKRQHSLGRADRLENVRNAYEAGEEAAGKTWLLMDDIVTTGATLCQCAEALYRAGAKEVWGLCAASAQKEGKSHGTL